jgi:hypothetical protein
MQRALGEAMRRLDLTDDLRDRHRALLADAVKHADGYVLDGWTGPAPEDLLPAMADLLEAMNDAPMDELEWDDERMDPARVRRGEEYRAEMGWRTHRVVARHEVSGELAGLTEVAVHPEGWTHAFQLDTCVARAHRGHRLGLVLKLAMLQRLADLEPQLRVIDTWNAASNLHMIGVNEALGCRVVYTSAEWQLSVAEALSGP